MRRRRRGRAARVLLTALLFGALLWTAGPAIAKKPANPPPPPPDPGDSGLIYFQWIQDCGVMQPDGTEKTVLFRGYPSAISEGRHGTASERWFLVTVPNENSVEHSGQPRFDLYAKSESGDLVLLMGDPDIELNNLKNSVPSACPAWGTDGSVVDGKVSFLGKHWVENPADSGHWSVDEWGLFVASLDPADLESPSAPNLQWICHDIGFEIVNFGTEEEPDPVMWVDYAWSPDGSSIAFYDRYYGTGVHRADYDASSGWSTELLTTTGYDCRPRWSPDGTQIAFHSGAGIHIIDEDGRNETTIVKPPKDKGQFHYGVIYPSWSPNGTHLVYMLYKNRDWSTEESNIFRVKADGSSPVNLTADIDRFVNAPVWRTE